MRWPAEKGLAGQRSWRVCRLERDPATSPDGSACRQPRRVGRRL